MKYPFSKRENIRDNCFGVKVEDPYRWLENNNDEEVRKWDNEQNSLAEAILKDTPEYNKFFNFLEKYSKEKTIGFTHRSGAGEFKYRMQKSEEDQKYVLMIKENEKSEWRVLLNPNKWQNEETLAWQVFSDSGKYLAYGVSCGGDENPVMKIMEVSSGKIIEDKFAGWQQYLNVWLPDESGFYYSCKPNKGEVPENEHFYWERIYLHKTGTSYKEDKLVFCDTEEKERWVSVYSDRESKYLLWIKGKFYQNQFWLSSINEPDKRIPVTKDMQADNEMIVHKNKIYINSKRNNPNGKIFVSDVNNPYEDNWKPLIEEREFPIESFAVIDNRIWVEYIDNVMTKISVFDLSGNFIKNVNLPDCSSAFYNGYPDSGEVEIYINNYNKPGAYYFYDFEKDELSLNHAPDYIDDFGYLETKQIWYKSKDGTKVPMYVITKKDFVPDGKTPFILYGYGGFNISLLPNFSFPFAGFVKAGGAVAIANIRGGGEFGEEWHRAGMFGNKQNVFDDFISAAEWLLKNKYTGKDKLAIMGGSNGGLLVGAVMMQIPELLKAVVCQVPLLDMVRYHNNKIARIWIDEYGCAENEEDFKNIIEYSPYHQLKEGINYPTTLFTTGINDARVDPYHARKMAALLQNHKDQKNKIMLIVEKDSGHGGGTSITVRNRQIALYYAFLMQELNMFP